jgi:hypothetical protein
MRIAFAYREGALGDPYKRPSQRCAAQWVRNRRPVSSSRF